MCDIMSKRKFEFINSVNGDLKCSDYSSLLDIPGPLSFVTLFYKKSELSLFLESFICQEIINGIETT